MAYQKKSRVVTLEEYIIQAQNKFPGATGELSQLLRDIGLASKIISREVNKAGITNILGEDGSKNVHGESVKKLDIFADEQLINALNRSEITCMVISEENDGIVELDNDGGKYIVYMDPLDGSSNIDVNVSIGSIFSIYIRQHPGSDRLSEQEALQPGIKQVAAGYVLYGSSTMLAYTTGLGVSVFTLDPSIGEFILSDGDVHIPDYGTIYSVNEGSYHSWDQGLKQYVKYCQVEDSPTRRPYKARYIGSMVADVHRTLVKGGIFIYPNSSLYPSGKLRLMYECNPLSFLIEQAGGMAIDGRGRILEIHPESIHQRTPIFIGSRDNVLKVKEFLDKYPAESTKV
ncbi:class 1 fructose-bisphosphatase [Fodinibius sediminis]|uniref:Fructose-1,6-bisphosphatase class 1 n=1 Tax=Fodinibius sediminis TaxID=1214077 RepID=A0A521E6Z1_9BACT|nr:class 1 fructose-bisphosphatase [Fodinibius sediminis]SMO79171.1 fructose-1,6-bisphosphatase I [Fodinibius sediminis]